ncbi:hypothetical protein ACIPYS_22250 [Kitasatospora sp. NPDC089913]|nr:hypothetical protein [Streptomyces sp. TLI_053]SDS79439.1 hypothetical protein SAMN05216371_0630 [Streptomyces sp. TLI_053]
MDTWLTLVSAAGEIASFAGALISALTALGDRRRAADKPTTRHHDE